MVLSWSELATAQGYLPDWEIGFYWVKLTMSHNSTGTDDETSQKISAVQRVVAESDVTFNPAARRYYRQFVDGESGLGPSPMAQLAYLISNIDVVDDESKKLKRQLEAIRNGEDPDDVDLMTDSETKLTERESGEISRGFESFVEQKVQRNELVTLDDYERYAQQTEYSLEKVLAANPWSRSVVTEEALQKIEEAEENIEFPLHRDE